MDETAYLTDCSTFSHNSVSTLDGKNEFIPQSILFILRKKDKSLISKIKPLLDHYQCPFKSVSKDNFCESVILDGSLVVLDEFEGPIFECLRVKLALPHVSIQVRGPPALIDACDSLYIETNKRPLYCNIMSSMVFWISGFQYKKKLKVEIANLVRYMGGSVAKQSGNRVTHVIADSSLAEGYSYATTFLVGALSIKWVYDCWEKRNEIGFKASQLHFGDYGVKIFCNLFVCFVGFEQNDDAYLQRLGDNEGTLVPMDDSSCTHIVVNDDEKNVAYNFESVPPHVYIVKSEWFWTSIKEEQKKQEELYLFTNVPESPVACQKKSYSLNCCLPSTPVLNFPDNGCLNNNESCTRNLFEKIPLNKKTHTLLELYQTEENYVNVLSTIMKIQEHTTDPTQRGGALLSEGEARIIFGNVAAIHRVHLFILQDLIKCAENWNDAETLIGPIFSDRAQELLECYSPFIRYFDVSNNILSDCEKKNHRFHAYLQLCKNNECGRQNMKDLLIRPVQRLASTSLLLKDLIKTTSPDHPDFLKLKEALRNIEQVMSTINNDRKDIADRSTIFDVFNLIENCPPVLVSADRTFIFQFEAQEVSEAHAALSKRGDYLVFYIFTDCLEICRKKKKVAATTKEGSIVSDKLMKLMHGKPFKHVVLMHFSTVRSIDNIVIENDSRGEFFGLTCRKNEELTEKHHLFRFIKYINTSCDKLTILTVLKKIMEQSKAGMTVQPKIVTKNAKEVGLNVSNLQHGINTLTNFAYKTQVFVESVMKNVDSLSPELSKQYNMLSCPNFQKSMSLDNLLTEIQRKQEDTSVLQTASFPVGKR